MKIFCFQFQKEAILKELGFGIQLESFQNDEEFLARKSEIDLFIGFGESFISKLSILEKFLSPPQCLLWMAKEKLLASHPVGALPQGAVLVDIEWAVELKQKLVTSFLNYLSQNKAGLLLLNRSVDPILLQVEKELSRAKKIHEYFLPKRFSKLKGVEIAAKYDAGASGGGEFFDVLKDHNRLLLMMSSCRSYLSSSTVLNHFTQLNPNKDLSPDGLDRFERNTFSDLKTSGLDPFKKEYAVNLLLFFLELGKLHYEARIYGQYLICGREKLINSGNHFEFCPEFSHQIKISGNIGPGDRMIFISPGLRKNANNQFSNLEIHQYIARLAHKNAHELVNDLLFEIHRKKNGDYLDYDSSAIVMDIQENKIYEI